ncbi:MarR family transcriptional regulator [Rhizobiales bacterium]|uniref:MarR family winged helix-turn-helix transcriptional regulator n=1 Tax=Hongsoonwoonella zoysiae TaxID=2821844 RepID=UPI00155F9DB1|nr:MarR family transcriptional regulator [Hongsoonwoonella zoysiae]NRG17101.1 MarR family transcriptional regulator [Hongsoonwoonella zoysiae]
MSATQYETLGFVLSDLSRLYRKHFEVGLLKSGIGLTPGAARALAYAYVYEGMRQRDLAERMGVEPMTLVGYLDQLEGKGLIERAADPSDRRCKLIRATREAEATISDMREVGARVRGLATKGMNDEEVETLRLTLLSIRDRLAETPMNDRPGKKSPELEGSA